MIGAAKALWWILSARLQSRERLEAGNLACGISSTFCVAVLHEDCGFGILTGFSSSGSIGFGLAF